MKFSNLKLKTRIVLFVGFMVVALMGLSVLSVFSVKKVVQGGEDMFQYNFYGVQYSSKVETLFYSMATVLLQHIIADQPEQKDELEKMIADEQQEMDETIKNFETTIITEKEKELVQRIRDGLEVYYAQIPELIRLSRQMETQEATGIAQELGQIRADQVMPYIEELLQFNIELAQERNTLNRSIASSAEKSTYVGLIIVAALAGVVGWFIIRSIVKPVHEVQEVAMALAAGDLRKQIKHQSKDEIGIMASAINQAIVNLQTLISHTVQISEQVASSSQQLSASAETVGEATLQVTEAISQLAKGADDQAEAASETGREVDSISKLIQRVAQSTQNMSQDTGKVTQTTLEGQQVVDQAIRQMESIKQTVDQSAATVKHLGEKSVEIGQIVDVIQSIAGQTNLLALNAAIEAARAGEHGRGFAVVAEEVRKLAEQTQDALRQVGTLIEEIQEETSRAVNDMQSGTEEVATGVQVIGGTGKSFSAIAHVIESVVGQIQEVADIAQNLAVGSEHVVQEVENIAAISQESAASTEEISASSEEQSASVAEIASSAQGLAELAQQLQRAVNEFKL